MMMAHHGSHTVLLETMVLSFGKRVLKLCLNVHVRKKGQNTITILNTASAKKVRTQEQLYLVRLCAI